MGDIDGLVPDAFQLGANLHRHCDESQVAGGRLAQREEFDAAVVDLHLEPVEVVIVHVNAPRGLIVALQQRFHRFGKAAVGECGHLQQLVFEGRKFLIEMSFHEERGRG